MKKKYEEYTDESLALKDWMKQRSVMKSLSTLQISKPDLMSETQSKWASPIKINLSPIKPNTDKKTLFSFQPGSINEQISEEPLILPILKQSINNTANTTNVFAFTQLTSLDGSSQGNLTQKKKCGINQDSYLTKEQSSLKELVSKCSFIIQDNKMRRRQFNKSERLLHQQVNQLQKETQLIHTVNEEVQNF